MKGIENPNIPGLQPQQSAPKTAQKAGTGPSKTLPPGKQPQSAPKTAPKADPGPGRTGSKKV